MSEEIDVPLQLSAGLESAVRKIAKHTGYTRDEVIEKMMSMTLDLAEASSDRTEMPSFLLTIKKALGQTPPSV